MVKRFLGWVIGQSQVERLLLAATVVAALRMMLIHAAFIGFDLAGWPWFMSIEVWSGLAFAVLEGKALAYVSKLWVGLKPARRVDWLYWGLLAAGQLFLLGSIIGVTAFAATSVRREVGVDALLGEGGAVAWSMFVTALNPLMVILIGIARAVDPDEVGRGQDKAMSIRSNITWLSVEDQARIFIGRWKGGVLTPPELIYEFGKATGIELTVEEASRHLVAAAPVVKVGRNGKG